MHPFCSQLILSLPLDNYRSLKQAFEFTERGAVSNVGLSLFLFSNLNSSSMDSETIRIILIAVLLIQLAVLISFFVMVNDIRAIKKKIRAGSYTNKTNLLKELEKAKFLDYNDEILSLYKELAYMEITFPDSSIESLRLKKLEEIASEIESYGGKIPSGLSDTISSIKSRVKE